MSLRSFLSFPVSLVSISRGASGSGGHNTEPSLAEREREDGSEKGTKLFLDHWSSQKVSSPEEGEFGNGNQPSNFVNSGTEV